MKKISHNKKYKVIKMFFSGYTYDEIALELGIAKGSVVNIIDEFKAGELPIAPNEYIDALRELAVDMRKQHTTVKKLKMYDKIHKKIAEMGVSMEQVDDWLEISQDIATESISAKHFVTAALHLAQLEAESGHDPKSLVAKFESKYKALKTLQVEIVETKGTREKEAAELDSIKKAKIEAQEQYDTQTAVLKRKLDDYLAQNKLSWEKVETVLAVLNVGLSNSGLGDEDMKKVSGDITCAGSLAVYLKEQEAKKAELETKINQLSAERQELENSNYALSIMKNDLTMSVKAKTDAEKEIASILQVGMTKLAEVEHIISCHIDLICITRLLLNFLTTSDELKDSDIEELTRMIIFIRQARLGITREKYKFINGNYIYECRLPPSYFAVSLKYPCSINMVREKLAIVLVPLVENKFMPRWEWDLKELQKINQKLTDMWYETLKLT